MKKSVRLAIILTAIVLFSGLSSIPIQSQNNAASYNSTESYSQEHPLRVALMWSSKLPEDFYINTDVELIEDIFYNWKLAPIDIVDLSEGLNAINLVETYSTVIIPSIELLSPYSPAPLSNETIEEITSVIIDSSLSLLLGNAQEDFDFGNPIYEAVFDMKTDGTQFVMGDEYELLYHVEIGDINYRIARNGNNIILRDSTISEWWSFTGYDEREESKGDIDFTASDFFKTMGIVLPEATAWVFGVPAFTLRNDDIYVRSWRFEADLEAIKLYAAFLRHEAGYIEPSNGVVGLYDQETNFDADPYQKMLGDYGRLVSHSWTHPFLTTLTLEEQVDQLAATKEYLAETYPDQFDSSLFIVPNNDWDEQTVVALNKTNIPIFTAAKNPVPHEYMASPAKEAAFLLYGDYTVNYEGQDYSVYGFPWMYAYDADATEPGSQGDLDLNRSPEDWVNSDYAEEGFSQTERALSQYYFPLMMGTHGVLQAWEYFSEWADITSAQIEGLHNAYPYLRVAENGAAVGDVMNLEDLSIESASYDDSEIALNLNNPGPEIRNAVFFTKSFSSKIIDQVFVQDSVYLGYGEDYVFLPTFTGSLQIRIKLVSENSSLEKMPILQGITTGGLKSTELTESELSIEISGYNPPSFETTILSIDFSRLDDPSNVNINRVYVQGTEHRRGIYLSDDLKQDWDGWEYDPNSGILRVKVRISGTEKVHVQLSETPLSPNHRPTAAIQSPVEGTVFAVAGGSTLSLEAKGVDEDGDTLIYFWSSSIDGELGNSSKIEINGADLSAGNHTLTLIVAENGPNYSLAGKASVEIQVTPRSILSPLAQNLLIIAAIFCGVLVIIPLVVKNKSLAKKKDEELENESSLGELLYYAFLSNGPWLVATGIFLILGMGFMILMEYPEKRFFAFSLGIATPLSLIVAGWLVGISSTSIADYYLKNKLFSCRHFMRRFLFITILTIGLISVSAFGIMLYFGQQFNTALLTFFFIISFTPLWYALGVLNAFKQYGRMTLIFLGGIGIGYSLSILFTTTGKTIPLIGLAYGTGYLIATASIFFFIFTSLIPTPNIQPMNEEGNRHLLALLANPTRKDTIKVVEDKTSLRAPFTTEEIEIIEDGLKLRLKESSAISIRKSLTGNSWLIIGAICYASFVWVDRIFVWLTTGQQTSGFVLAINSNYEIGINIGLWVLIFTTGMIAYVFRDFTDRYNTATNKLYSGTLDEIDSDLAGLSRNVFGQLLRIVAMATIIAVILFINGPQILKIFNVGRTMTDLAIESMTPPSAEEIVNPSGSFSSSSLFVLRIATIDAIFIAVFLYTQLGLSYLAKYKQAAYVLLSTIIVSLPAVIIIILLGYPSYYAILGHLFGSIVAAILGIILLRKELDPDLIRRHYLSKQL